MGALPGVGRVALAHALQVMKHYPDAALGEILKLTRKAYPRFRLPDAGVLLKAGEQASRKIELMRIHNIALLIHAALPERLHSIPDPPALLFVKGNRSVLSGPGIAVVGTRTPTSWGEHAAWRFGHLLAEHACFGHNSGGALCNCAIGTDGGVLRRLCC